MATLPTTWRTLLRKQDNHRDDPYWAAFISRPLADPDNLVTNALKKLTEGGVNPARGEVHSPNVMASHIKELGRFFGADQVGILELASNPFEDATDGRGEAANGPYFAIVCALEADHDTRTSPGVGGQAPAVKGLFATFNLSAYIREIGYRATRSGSVDGERMAAQAGLGTLDEHGRLVSMRLGRKVHVPEVIFTELPLAADARESAP